MRMVFEMEILGSSYLLGLRFRACFILKFAYQRERGRKGRECKFKTKHTEPLNQEIHSELYGVSHQVGDKIF